MIVPPKLKSSYKFKQKTRPDKSETYSGLKPHKVRSSQDELNAADICKALRDVETGRNESTETGARCPP